MKFLGFLVCFVVLVTVAYAIAVDTEVAAAEAVVPTGESHTLKESLKIPSLQRSCNNGECNMICVLLGYWFGTCGSDGWCYCYA